MAIATVLALALGAIFVGHALAGTDNWCQACFIYNLRRTDVTNQGERPRRRPRSSHCVSLAPAAASAATFSSFCSGGLPGYGFCQMTSSYNANYMQLDADHNSVCIGSGKQPGSNSLRVFPDLCATSGGSISARVGGTGYPFVENHHSFGVTIFTSTHFNY